MMNSIELIKQQDETVEILLRKNLQLAQEIGECQTDSIIEQATAIKIVLENAQALNNILFVK
ncbi:hypothetical protein [Sporomusa aerivorans]|uniref:hypothetical protein n=1 Tax=Sporomusa aerivorans TaxID=204936 RepID=UPI00352AC015